MKDAIKQKTLLEEIQQVKSAIATAKEADENLKLKSNYDGGLAQCNQLIAIVQEHEIDFPCDELLGSFIYYITDSLPWTGNILESVENMLRKLKKFGIISRK